MTYTLLHSLDLFSGAGSGAYPYSAPATAILSDGTYLIASRVDEVSSLERVRLWHLAANLSVLGSADIVMGASDSAAPYLVATGMSAVLITRVGWTPKTFFTYLIDCTGSAPSVGSGLAMATIYQPLYDDGVVTHVYDAATNRIALLSMSNLSPDSLMLQVFNSTTGALLSEAKAAGSTYTPTGLYMDPADHTKFAAYDDHPHQIDFTVALDGSTCIFDGLTAMAGIPTSGIYPGAAGSPYIAGGPGLIAEATSGAYPVNYYAADGSVPASTAGVGGEFVNLFGPSVTLGDSKHLIAYAEMTNGTWFEGRLFAVDQSVPTTMVELSLPYPVTGVGRVYSYVFDLALMAVDQTTGIILIGATVQDSSFPAVISLILWAVQGPANKPNLTGQPLDDRVRFTDDRVRFTNRLG